MARAGTASKRHRSSRHRSSGRRAVPIGLCGTFLVGLGSAVFVPDLAWPLANLALLGGPACLGILALREGVRIVLALGLGFQVFGVRWGAGPGVLRFRIGAVHQRFGPIPLLAESRLASCHPRHHQLARWLLVLAPLLAQALVVAIGLQREAFVPSALESGFAPLVMLQIANLALLLMHVFIPFETPSGLCTDLRLMSDLALAGPEEARAGRASAHALRIERMLETGDLDRAFGALATAMTQLGREPMLVQIEDRLARVTHALDPVAAGREEAISDPFEHPWSHWDRSTASHSLMRRLARGTLGWTPATIAVAIIGAFLYDDLLSSTHTRWAVQARSIAETGDTDACREHMILFERRLARTARLVAFPRELQIRQLRERAGLHACQGDLARAILDQSLAVQIADTLREGNDTNPGHENPRDSDPADSALRIEAELNFSAQLRQLAVWHAERGAYRQALQAAGRADRELQIADARSTGGEAPGGQAQARGLFDQERREIARTRSEILQRMGTQG